MDFVHLYEARPRKDRYGVDLISDALPFGSLWYLKARRCRLREAGKGRRSRPNLSGGTDRLMYG
jgi:hypothetical protein